MYFGDGSVRPQHNTSQVSVRLARWLACYQTGLCPVAASHELMHSGQSVTRVAPADKAQMEPLQDRLVAALEGLAEDALRQRCRQTAPAGARGLTHACTRE